MVAILVLVLTGLSTLVKVNVDAAKQAAMTLNLYERGFVSRPRAPANEAVAPRCRTQGKYKARVWQSRPSRTDPVHILDKHICYCSDCVELLFPSSKMLDNYVTPLAHDRELEDSPPRTSLVTPRKRFWHPRISIEVLNH